MAQPAGPSQDGDALNLPPELRQLLGTNWTQLEKDTVTLLQQLIRIDTQNMGEEGSEIEAVRHLEAIFKEAGIENQVILPKPGRGNIVARIRGDGSSKQGALLLSAHLDTVKAPRENWEAEGWKHDPFGGVIDQDDDCLYGRGAIDMKHMAAMSVTLLCFIKKNNILLTRDLIFAGLADEERPDSKWGVKYLVENCPELIEADIVFNEVGGMSLHVQGMESVMVQIAEKGLALVKITASGPGGHGSIYHETNPVAVVGGVAQRLQTCKLPLRVNSANTATIESMSACLPFPKSLVFRQIFNPYLSDVIMNRLVPPNLRNSLGPLLRNTANPTSMVGGEGQHNQIPASAHVIVDCRVLPECTPEEAVEDIKTVLGPHRFKPSLDPVTGTEVREPELHLEVLKTREACHQDLSETACRKVLDVIRQVVRHRTDGAPVTTILIPGCTDSYFYSKHPTRTPVCLGFAPVRFEEGMKFADLYHGTNERIPLAGLRWGVKVFADVVLLMCGARRIRSS